MKAGLLILEPPQIVSALTGDSGAGEISFPSPFESSSEEDSYKNSCKDSAGK